MENEPMTREEIQALVQAEVKKQIDALREELKRDMAKQIRSLTST